MNTKHFGGDHTRKKLDVLRQYLQAWNTALKNQVSFRRVYIDLFAGAGTWSSQRLTPNNHLLPGIDMFSADKPSVNHPGSARIAMETVPPFHRLIFVEKDIRNTKKLHQMTGRGKDKRIEIHHGNAEEKLPLILNRLDPRRDRAVMFIDPFAMQTSWDMLRRIAEKPCIDGWYLFPLSALCRQMARNPEKIDNHKEEAITRLMGTAKWREDLYEPQQSLFPDLDAEHETRADINMIEKYVKARLSTIFPLVLPPMTLRYNRSNAPAFSLFFFMTNPGKKAQTVAKRIAGHILKQAGTTR